MVDGDASFMVALMLGVSVRALALPGMQHEADSHYCLVGCLCGWYAAAMDVFRLHASRFHNIYFTCLG